MSRVRRGAATGLLLVTAVILFLVGFGAACSDDEEGVSPSGENPAPQTEGPVEAEVGETVELGDGVLLVSALFATEVPTIPDRVVGIPTGARRAPQGTEFRQAMVRVENRGIRPIRVDPEDFWLQAEDRTFPPDTSRSGPPARSLLEGASLDLILTFPVPTGVDAELRYYPDWYDGSIVFEGSRRPAGFVGTEEDEQ